MSVTTSAWLDFFRSEYLDDFVRDGGATVKFLVGGIAERRAIADGLKEQGEGLGYIARSNDGTVTKLHLIEQLFFALARQLNRRDIL